jgi:hypothetical protein
MVVTDKCDFVDPGLAAFVDFEHEVNSIIGKFDIFRVDADVIAAAVLIDIDNALNVGLHNRA